MLVRVTRNCPWNRCAFCGTYGGARFELRSPDEVKSDILAAKSVSDAISGLAARSGSDIREVAASVYQSSQEDSTRNVALWMYAGGTSSFLQDANTLIQRTPDLVEVISYLKGTFPSVERITTYARSHTAARKSVDELRSLRIAGLSRIHIGLESGCDKVLADMDKGVTAAEHIAGGRNVVESGISLSEYVMPGLGGRKWRRENAVDTATVLSEINPDFIRLRTLTPRAGTRLYDRVLAGDFVPPSEDEMVEEIGWLIEGLTCGSEVKSDHMMNLLPEIDGKLPIDKDHMLDIVKGYLGLSDAERANFKIGRRSGYYNCMADMSDPARREAVDRLASRLLAKGEDIESTIPTLRAERSL